MLIVNILLYNYLTNIEEIDRANIGKVEAEETNEVDTNKADVEKVDRADTGKIDAKEADGTETDRASIKKVNGADILDIDRVNPEEINRTNLGTVDAEKTEDPDILVEDSSIEDKSQGL